jgi:uncharacterized protein (TIGR03437 family)
MKMRFAFLLLPLTAGVAADIPAVSYSEILPVITQGNLNSGLVKAVATDSAGNTYITGSTENAAFPVTAGALQTKGGGGTCTAPTTNPQLPPITFPCDDAFLMKLDSKGAIVFATLLGGDGFDQATSIALDAAGNIYLAGYTTPATLAGSNSFPVTPGTAFAGTGGVFIAKINPSGTALVYSTLVPGVGGAAFVTADSSGNAYFSATALSFGTPFPTTPGALQQSGGLVVGKLNATGSVLLYGAQFGGTGGIEAETNPSGIAVDSLGDAFVSGSTASSDFPVTTGAFQTKLANNAINAFVAKVNPSGSALVYATFLGGSSVDLGGQIRVDAQGEAYIEGSVSSADFPVTSGSFQSTGASMGFITKLNASGTALAFSSLIAGANSFDIDPAGNVYVTGGAAPGLPTTQGATQACVAGGAADAYVLRLSSTGTLSAATYFGGSARDAGLAIAAAPDGSAIVAGSTDSLDFPVTSGLEPLTSTTFAARFAISDPSQADVPCISRQLQNGASFAEGPVSPGELVTLRGLHFGPDMGLSGQLDSTGSLGTSLGGVRVFFDDIPAPLLYVQSQQINAQAPWELAGKTTTNVHVEFQGALTPTRQIQVAAASPAFFRSYTSSQGAILNEDGTPNSVSNPAKPGSAVAIFGTGGGPFSPALRTGGLAPLTPLSHLTAEVAVLLDFAPAEVLYSGSAPTLSDGVFQINFRVPQVQPVLGPQVINATFDTASTDVNNSVTIAVGVP